MVRFAVASNRLEGLRPPVELLADLRAVATGDRSGDEVVAEQVGGSTATTGVSRRRFDARPGEDPYTDPASGVLWNRLGITSQAVLEDLEARATAVRTVELLAAPLPAAHRGDRSGAGQRGLDHLRAVHRRIFGDLFDWAGELRTINIAKESSLFCLVAHLESAARALFDELAAGPPLSSEPDGAAAQLAHHLAELNALHPFREGNGRAQRALLWRFALSQGWAMGWDEVDPAENGDACNAALRGDERQLARLVRRGLTSLGAKRSHL